MSQPTPQRVHLFHDTRMLATIQQPTARPEPYYTLDDGTVVQSISYLTVTHSDGTAGLDIQVVPVVPDDLAAPPTAQPRAAQRRAAHTGHRA